MNRIYIFLLLLISVNLGCLAQEQNNDAKRKKMFEEVQEFKMKYLAQEMNLSEEQKVKFFEIYSEFSKSREECFKDVRKLERKLKKSEQPSEEEYQKLTDARNKANIEFAEIEKNYDEKFSEFLTSKQIYEMKEGEKNFRNKLEEMRRDKHKEHKRK